SDKRNKDVFKVRQLRKAGWTVVRVRERPLRLITRDDVSVPLHASVKECANAVLVKLETLISGFTPSRDYLNGRALINDKAASMFLSSLRRVDRTRLRRRLRASTRPRSERKNAKPIP